MWHSDAVKSFICTFDYIVVLRVAMRRIQLIVLCCFLFCSAVSTQLLCYGADGTPIPCYPPYGDVAAGLVPVATSTCSLAGPACEKCSPCDANVASQSHPASQTTDGSSDTYWQSANVSPGESANLTYNLGGVYEVMNVSVEFVGPVPNITVLLKQADAGETFVTLLSYSAALCKGKKHVRLGGSPSVVRRAPDSHLRS